jgi:hypothetical protein
MPLDFIFMLTRDDKTVGDALVRVPEVLAAGVKHIGFKDIGLDLSVLKELSGVIRDGGATLYLEVVSLDREREIASAEVAVTLGVDWLLGGTRPDDVLPVIAGTAIRYAPFPGHIVGHPSRLDGTVDEIVASARDLAGRGGIAGLDLLAYRSPHGPALISAVPAAVGVPVIVAGSIDSEARIAEVADGGAAAFTVGTAAFDGAFAAQRPGLTGQCEAILEAAASSR